MSSLSKHPKTGKYRINYRDLTGRQKSIMLPTDDCKMALQYRTLVDLLIEEQKTGERRKKTDLLLCDISEDIRKRLVKAGLIKEVEVWTVQRLFDEFLSSQKGESTRIVRERAIRYFNAYFKNPNRHIDTITSQECVKFRDWIETAKPFKGDKECLGSSTLSKMVNTIKQIFTYAVNRGYLGRNPFAVVKGGSMSNPERMFDVNQEMSEKILNACPDTRWRCIFVLARYIGLRIPSELVGLKWSDITWSDSENSTGKIKITDPKRKIHGKGFRVSPLWANVEAELSRLYHESQEGDIYVFSGVMKNANLRTQYLKILKRAGVAGYPKAFQNLRSTCETDYCRKGVKPNMYTQWLGHSKKVSDEHYIQYNQTDFNDGVNSFLSGLSPLSPSVESQKPVEEVPSLTPVEVSTKVSTLYQTVDDTRGVKTMCRCFRYGCGLYVKTYRPDLYEIHGDTYMPEAEKLDAEWDEDPVFSRENRDGTITVGKLDRLRTMLYGFFVWTGQEVIHSDEELQEELKPRYFSRACLMDVNGLETNISKLIHSIILCFWKVAGFQQKFQHDDIKQDTLSVECGIQNREQMVSSSKKQTILALFNTMTMSGKLLLLQEMQSNTCGQGGEAL